MEPKESYSLTIVGATGAVGTALLPLLNRSILPVGNVRLCASHRSAGRILEVCGRRLSVEEVSDEALASADFVLISASTDVSREVAPRAARLGAIAIDDSSAYRMDPSVPLVVPEINAKELDTHSGIVSIPNCSTTPLAMVLDVLGRLSPIERVIAATYQSVSGTGSAAVSELKEQTGAMLAGGTAEPRVYRHQIAFNALPQIGEFEEDGYTGEELKMLNETRKILGRPDLPISATCVRVPVMVGHSTAVQVEQTQAVNPADAREALAAYPGIAVVDDPLGHRYPMPVDAAGRDEILVGRIRSDASHPRGLALWISSDNLLKGAALNALQIAGEMARRGLVRQKGADRIGAAWR